VARTIVFCRLRLSVDRISASALLEVIAAMIVLA